MTKDTEEKDQGRENTESLTNLTDWENEPTLLDLKQDYTDAQSDHSGHISKVDTWLENLNVTGAAAHKAKPGKSSVVPKLIRKQAEWRYAALTEPFLSTEDIFNVSPVTYEDKQAAEQNELVLNNQFNTKINKTAFIDEYIRTAVDEGTVIVRTGWAYEEDEREVEVPQFNFVPTQDPNIIQQHEQIHQLMQTNPQAMAEQVSPEMQQAHQITMQQGIPIAPVPAEPLIETETVVVKNQPTLDICNYRNLIIDPSAMGDIDKASFVIYRFETSMSELEKEGDTYSRLSEINIENNSVLAEPDYTGTDESSFTFNDKPRKKMVAYEYWGFWDIHGDGIVVPIIATWVGETLIRMEENPFPDKALPFVVVQYLPVRKSMYGEPDGSLLEDNQKIIGAVTRGMIDIMGRSANGQQGSRKDALDTTNKRKFDKGLDYEYNPSIDARAAFHMHTFPEIPQSAQYMLNQQNAEAESLTGVKAFSSSGITGTALGDTATGVRSALDATAKRELGILRRLAEGIKQIGRKFISMNTEFLEDEEIIRITNDDFVPVRRDDLAGNIDLKLTISTAEADNQKAEELAFMLQTTGNTMGTGLAQVILAEIATLRKMPALAKKIEEFKQEPDPIVQQKAQLEVELLQAQIETERSKATENYAEAELDKSKARDISSGADLKDLDYVETESGVKQDRDIAKMRAQSEGNIILKTAEANLKKDTDRAKAAEDRVTNLINNRSSS